MKTNLIHDIFTYKMDNDLFKFKSESKELKALAHKRTLAIQELNDIIKERVHPDSIGPIQNSLDKYLEVVSDQNYFEFIYYFEQGFLDGLQISTRLWK